jgi:predicted dehydrogenase
VSGWGEEPADNWGTIGSGDQVERVPTDAGAYQRFYAAMVEAIRGGTPAPVDPHDAVGTLEVLEAARRSSDEKHVVTLDESDNDFTRTGGP